MKKTIYILILLTSVVSITNIHAQKKYAEIELSGSVNPVISQYIVNSIVKAQADNNEFILILMDTPGGFIGSMRDIIKAVLTSKIPVVVYTYPKGAQAASAGGFIMLSAHVAVMAPGTEIGAMHPVSPMLDFMKKDSSGGPAGVMEKKVLNDTVAYAKSLAERRGRNQSWAVSAVSNASSSSYTEALRSNVIDFIAEDISDLMKKLNGRSIDLNGSRFTFDTQTVQAARYEMNWKERLINYFADPQIVLILFVIAIAGIGIEFKNPGMIVPGTIGAVSFLLFLLAVRILPVNSIGLLLIAFSIVLFILELKITSYGLLTVAGIFSFAAGSLMLFDSPLQGGGVPVVSIVSTAVFILLFIFLVVRSIINVHKEKVSTGIEGLIGESGTAIREFNGKGKIKIHGEIWNAVSAETIAENEKVTVESVQGMKLFVKK